MPAGARGGAAHVQRVFPAGPPAAIMLYTLAPELLLGWPRANRPEEREFLLPDVGSRPEVGRITGRGNTANLEGVLALKPDLILDIGSDRRDLRLARRPRAGADRHSLCAARRPLRRDRRQPTACSASSSAGARQAEALARYAERDDRHHHRPHRRDRRRRSVRASIMRAGRAGSRPGSAARSMSRRSRFWRSNVAGETRVAGSRNVSIEQVLVWNPDVIVTIDQDFAANVRRRSGLGAGRGGARPGACICRPSCRSAGSIFRLR